VKVDIGQMEQVLMNLVINARDAMPTGGVLVMATRNVVLDDAYVNEHLEARVGPHVMLYVSDTGEGMDEATKSRLFEPFFTTKEKGRGTGLGLSTVYGIVRQSGGSIWVDSETGRGTTFEILLPCAADTPDISAPRSVEVSERGGTETILLVEDDEQVRTVAHEILRRNGYVVLEARDADEALAVSSEHPGTIDLLLTDVVMPKMNGRELARKLASLRSDTRVLFMSGYTSGVIVQRDIVEAGVSLVQKPFTPDVLLKKVREVIDSRLPTSATRSPGRRMPHHVTPPKTGRHPGEK
jgi:CheY-like chemotaxis protein